MVLLIGKFAREVVLVDNMLTAMEIMTKGKLLQLQFLIHVLPNIIRCFVQINSQQFVDMLCYFSNLF